MNDQNKLFKISVSKAKTYADCAAKYNYSYNLKLPQKNFRFFDFGKCAHQILEHFHLAYINGSEEPLHKVMEIAYKDAMQTYGNKLSTEDKQEIYSMIDIYLQKITKTKATISNVIAVEKNFNIPITDRININGMIDKVQKDNDGFIHVIDYKTSKSAKYLKKDWFQLQTYAYALWMEDNTITKIRGSYMMLRLGHQMLTKDFTMDEVLETKNKFETYAKSIEEDKLWRTNPTPLCSYCSFLEHCQAGKDFMNKGIKTGQVEW
jgi:CRISPR/Cas system-associated exonuclease Cas4 (RecB family)